MIKKLLLTTGAVLLMALAVVVYNIKLLLAVAGIGVLILLTLQVARLIAPMIL